MSKNGTIFPIGGGLVVIALAATVIALSLQMFFDRLTLLALLGQLIAALGATALALWLQNPN